MTARRIPDPVYGTIHPPSWLEAIDTLAPVRRMSLIRQLGLKAYIDFPGAIHTRYSHALGAMELSGRLTDLLVLKLEKERTKTVANLKKNRETIMAASFLHDVGHGPFSHAVDYPLRKLSGKTHEEIATGIISSELRDLQDHGIPFESVNRIITKSHSFPFIHLIVNGPLDVDKLDYLLRDSHHVGLKYSLDVENLIENYTVMGDDNDLAKCELGLRDTTEGITNAEIFLTMWKGMYDLVYHIESSRIAEKMLEHAILAGCVDNGELSPFFKDTKRITELYDEKLLEILQKLPGFPSEVAQAILTKRGLYAIVYEKQLNIEDSEISANFLEALKPSDVSEAASSMSTKLCTELKLEAHQIIFDIVKTRTPLSIHLDTVDENGDPNELGMRSPIVEAIKEKIYLKAYIHPSLQKKAKSMSLDSKISGLVASW